MAILPELLTARLTLRQLEFDDAPFIVRLLNEPSFIENIGDRGVRSIEDAHRYLREGPVAMYEKHGFGLWRVTRNSDGVAVGICGLLKRENLPDVDIGYAFEAAEATMRHAAVKFGLERVIAVVSQHNDASIRLLEKLGMAYERLFAMRPDEPEVRLYGRTL